MKKGGTNVSPFLWTKYNMYEPKDCGKRKHFPEVVLSELTVQLNPPDNTPKHPKSDDSNFVHPLVFDALKATNK